MRQKRTIHLTPMLDAKIQKMARQEGKSFNQMAAWLLEQGATDRRLEGLEKLSEMTGKAAANGAAALERIDALERVMAERFEQAAELERGRINKIFAKLQEARK